MINGTGRQLHEIINSDQHDLAKFMLRAAACSYLQIAAAQQLQQGDHRRYTTGTSAGLTCTVSAGIFTGCRDLEGRVVQTDAAINPLIALGP